MSFGTPSVGATYIHTPETSSSLSYPATVNAGDILVLVETIAVNTAVFALVAPDSTWTTTAISPDASTVLQIAISVKVADGTEGGGTLTRTHASYGAYIAQIIAVPGGDSSIFDAPTATLQVGTGVKPYSLSATSADNGAMYVFANVVNSSSATVTSVTPSGTTTLLTAPIIGSTTRSIQSGYYISPAAGALTIVNTWSASYKGAGIMVVLKPSAPPTGVVTATAGPDQIVRAGTTVSLSGSATTTSSGGTITSYSWTQTSGTTVTLSSTTAQNPTFTAPPGTGTLSFNLTATDSSSITGSDSVSLSVLVSPTFAIIGDSLTWRGGSTSSPPTRQATTMALFLADGLFGDPSSGYWEAIGGKPTVGTDANGRTMAQSVASAIATLGYVDKFVVATGSNDVAETDSVFIAGIQAVMTNIGTNAGRVYWMNLAAMNSGNTQYLHFNPIMASTLAAYPNVTFLDWNTYIHSASVYDPADWVSTDVPHMTPQGYAKRDAFIAASVTVTPTLLQSFDATSIANNNNVVLTVPSAIAVGSTIIVAINQTSVTGTQGVASIVDAGGNTWVCDARAHRANTHDMAVYSTQVTTSISASSSITITFNTATTRKVAIATVWSNISTVAATSGTTQGIVSDNVGPNGSSTTISATTTSPGAGLIISVGTRVDAVSLTAGSGYTLIDQVITAAGSAERGVGIEYLVNTSNVTQTATFTNSASTDWAGAIVAYNIAAGSTSVKPVTSVIVGGAKKTVTGQWVIVGGVKKTITSRSVIVGGVKKLTS